MANPSDPEGPEIAELTARDEGIATRVLSGAVRSAQGVAGITGVDDALDVAVEEAIVQALESPAVARAMIRLAEDGRLQEVIERAIAQADVEDAIARAIESDAADRIWAQLLASEKAQMLVERVAEAPEVRAAIAAQGFGLIGDIGRQVSRLTRALDRFLERLLRGLLRRPPRPDTRRVGLITRLLGALLDVAIFAGVVSLTVGLLAAIVQLIFGASDGADTRVVGLAAFGWSMIGLLTLFVFWSLAGQTPAMRFLGIRLDADGEAAIGFRRAFRRLVAVPVALLPLGAGFLAIVFGSERRGWHDRYAGTEVVYDEAKAPWAVVPAPSPPSSGGSEPGSAERGPPLT